MRKFISYDSHHALDSIYHFQITGLIRRFSHPSTVASGIGRNTTFFWPKFSSTGTDKNFWIYNKPGLAPGARIYILCIVSAELSLDRLISGLPRRNDARYVPSSILDDISPLYTLHTLNVGRPPPPTFCFHHPF